MAGTITGEDHAPVPRARVCVDLAESSVSDAPTRDPICVLADDRGAYRIEPVLPARVLVSAAAEHRVPAWFHPDGDVRVTTFALAPGEQRTGVDLTLRAGGALVTGTVVDMSGGPIAHAQVRARSRSAGFVAERDPVGETDEHGAFALWVRPGDVAVTAVADGYADATDEGRAPRTMEVLMTPASSLSGTVVDGITGGPVAGVGVGLEVDDLGLSDVRIADVTDEQGRFHVDRLAPGRYVVVARSPTGYGHSVGSTRVAFAQHADGVVVKLFPALRIAGQVMIAGATPRPCADPLVRVSRATPMMFSDARPTPDGAVERGGLQAGTYRIYVACPGYRSRASYPSVVLRDHDAVGLVWEVDPGATIRGHVRTRSGAPVAGASVHVRGAMGGGDPSTWTAADGSYALTGLGVGDVTLRVASEHGLAPAEGWAVSVPSATAIVERDLELVDGGAIHGTVVDAQGRPVAGVRVRADGVDEVSLGDRVVRTGRDGAFAFDDLRPGEYQLSLSRAAAAWLTEPVASGAGSGGDGTPGARVKVEAGQAAAARIVLGALTGAIQGRVVDAAGAPVTDAFVTAAREANPDGPRGADLSLLRWSADQWPVLTGPDGAFAIPQLAPGTYTLLAQRKGGAEVTVTHVAVGATVVLRVPATASLAGTVHHGSSPPAQFAVMVRNVGHGFHRIEAFYRTDGRYALHDLPAGHYTVTASVDGGQATVAVDLATSTSRSRRSSRSRAGSWTPRPTSRWPTSP